MKHTQELLESMVIHDYLGGNTRAQIALDHKTSTGNVSNITSEWAKRIGKHDAKEIREFVVLVKKSGLSIGQCAQGFRTAMLMKDLGINYDGDDDGKDANEEFTTFVKEIYLNCKNFGINPETISKWVKDLFDCYSVCVKNSKFFSFAVSCEEDKDTDLCNDGIKRINNKKNNNSNFQCISDPNSSDEERSSNLYGLNQGISNNEVETPFVSQISNFIAQKKKECAEIKDYERKLEDETKRLRNHENQIKGNLDKITQKETKALHYLDWFYKLKKELWDNYNIRIEEISRFAKVVNGFRIHNYDPYEIISEYSNFSSVGDEILTKRNEVETLQQMEKTLNGKIASLEGRLGFIDLTMNTYGELQAMKFGLKELKQLWSVVVEISLANNIPPEEAVHRFLKDVETQYDYKLGFEKKLGEIKAEHEKIKNELPAYRYDLHFQSIVLPVLNQLLQNGVTKEDIINLNQLVTDFANNDLLLSDSQSEIPFNKNKNKVMNRIDCWKIFMDKLRKLGDINSLIVKQKEKSDEVEKQIDALNRQKLELDRHSVTALSLLNYTHTQISYLIGCFSQIYKNLNKKINVPFHSSNLFINLIYIESGKDGKGEGQNN